MSARAHFGTRLRHMISRIIPPRQLLLAAVGLTAPLPLENDLK